MSKSVVAAYNAYPLTNENKCNNEINARRLGFQQGYEQAEKEYKNQWISVEEALPEVDGHGYSKPVLVRSDINELLVAIYSKHYDKWNVVGPLSYHSLVVKRWMYIPTSEGGEE